MADVARVGAGVAKPDVRDSLCCRTSVVGSVRAGLRGACCVVPVLVVAVSGCCPDVWYEISTPSPAARPPLDEAPHCYGGEWWYYTGRLVTEDGRGYGIEAVIFHNPQVPLLILTQGWAAHFAVLDESTGDFRYDQIRVLEPASFESAGHGVFDVSTPLVQMTGDDGRDHLRAAMTDQTYAIDLSLLDERGPVLHGDGGYVPFGQDGRSFYYSRPRMRASGTLEIDGQPRSVTGDLWFDRQWGRDLTNPWLGWDWYSLRLDDGIDVMLFVFRDATPQLSLGTYIPDHGEPRGLAGDDFVITPNAFWTSPHTGATYPVGWDIQVLPEQLYVTVIAIVDDQEFDARASTLNVYWEGMCNLVGTHGGRPVDGLAYVELANYVR